MLRQTHIFFFASRNVADPSSSLRLTRCWISCSSTCPNRFVRRRAMDGHGGAGWIAWFGDHGASGFMMFHVSFQKITERFFDWVLSRLVDVALFSTSLKLARIFEMRLTWTLLDCSDSCRNLVPSSLALQPFGCPLSTKIDVTGRPFMLSSGLRSCLFA